MTAPIDEPIPPYLDDLGIIPADGDCRICTITASEYRITLTMRQLEAALGAAAMRSTARLRFDDDHLLILSFSGGRRRPFSGGRRRPRCLFRIERITLDGGFSTIRVEKYQRLDREETSDLIRCMRHQLSNLYG